VLWNEGHRFAANDGKVCSGAQRIGLKRRPD
jgi:hypothetical protein